jgi:hypothetical protein
LEEKETTKAARRLSAGALQGGGAVCSKNQAGTINSGPHGPVPDADFLRHFFHFIHFSLYPWMVIVVK